MKTRKRTFKKSSLLLAVVALAGLTLLGFGTWVAAAPGAAPSAQFQPAPLDPLDEATCPTDATTQLRTCHLLAQSGMLPMPDGAQVPVWGFVDDDALVPPDRLTPGPVIRADVGETIVVVLDNQIPGETVSLAFPGQEGLVPDLDGVLTNETATYTLTPSTPGTFLYEAGMTSGGGRQVAMGLVGPLIVDDPTALPDQEVVLVFGGVDPAFNINPGGFNLNRFHTRYWLINGQAYPETGAIDVAAGDTLLLRYLNAGTEHHTLGLLGVDQSVVASNGEPLPYPQGAIAPSIAPGQTLDALVEVPLDALPGTLYPLYNASLHQHNNNQRISDTDTRVAFGGMLTYLRVTGDPPTPVGGPVASNVAVAPQKTNGTEDVVLSATLTDLDLVAAYEYFVDIAGDPGTGTYVDVNPDAPSPNVAVTFLAAEVATWGSGEHILYIRGQDALDAWGTLGSAVLNLDMAGPDITGLSLAPNPTNGGVDVLLTGTADDRNNGASDVVSAEYRVDGGANWLPMTLNSPNTPISGLSATLLAANVNALGEGVHTVMVQAWDDFGNMSVVPGTIDLRVDQTGPDSTVTLSPPTLDFNQQLPVTSVRLTATIADPLLNGVQSTVVNAEGFLFDPDLPGAGFNLYPSDGLFNEITEDAHYNIPVANFSTLPTGNYDILVVGKDKAGNWGPAGVAVLQIEAQVPDVIGPDITNPVADVARNGRRFDLTATATDAQSNVFGAVWFIGKDPDALGVILNSMDAVDGAYNSLSEDIEALRIDIRNWDPGTYEISVMAIDAAGNWGDFVTTSFDK